MRIVAGLLCILLAVTGCSEKDKIPSGVIGKEEMEKILWDMMLADQYSANYIVKDSAKVNVKMETLKLYEEVFRLHKVSRDEFRKSYQFYQERPDITRTMFDSLLARGNRARMENYARPPQTPTVTPPAGKAPDSAAIKARKVTNSGAKPVMAPTNKPGGVVPAGGKAPVTVPNRPVFNPAAKPAIFPNRPGSLSPGVRPFLQPNAGRPLKAGEMPFRPVKKDSVPGGKQ